jgi:hypothetical protein
MRTRAFTAVVWLLLPWGFGACSSADPAPPTPEGADGIALEGVSGVVLLDDLHFAAVPHRIVAAPGGSGRVHRVDVEAASAKAFDGFGTGAASVDEADGLAFVADRASSTLDVLEIASGKVVSRVELGGRPDYVRYCPITNEVWVTEPAEQRIEVLAFRGKPDLVSAAFISIGDGPEGLVFDLKRERAYVHHYQPKVAKINVRERRSEVDWPTGCQTSHGIPVIDEQRGLLFAGCRERAKVTVLSIDEDGKQLGTFDLGTGESSLAYSPSLRHFYLRGDPGVEIAVLDIPDSGSPVLLKKLATSQRGHVMAADDRGFLWVADPAAGRLLRYKDPSLP